MKNNYIYIFCLIIFTMIVISWSTVLLNDSQTSLKNSDNEIIRDFVDINMGIDEYYSRYVRLPSHLEEVTVHTETHDRILDRRYEYRKQTGYSYQLCAKFQTSTLDENEENLIEGKRIISPVEEENPYEHDLGYQCLDFQISYRVPTPKPSVSPNNYDPYKGIKHSSLQNGSFENWPSSEAYPLNWTMNNGNVKRNSNSFRGTSAVTFEGRGYSWLISNNVIVEPLSLLSTDVYYKTTSTCKKCAFVGFTFYNKDGKELTTGANKCGSFSTGARTFYSYIIGSTGGSYKLKNKKCITPSNAAYYKLKLGMWDGSNLDWEFDNVSVKETKLGGYTIDDL